MREERVTPLRGAGLDLASREGETPSVTPLRSVDGARAVGLLVAWLNPGTWIADASA